MARPKRGGSGIRRSFARSVPVLFGVTVMVVYFAWVCLQMAQHALGGGVLVAVIFGSVAVGTIGGAAGLWRGRS